ncbi:EAL domain-containing protein [Sulfuritalea hydrogenivorans]|jgi:diguanylate cyclase (GGDEF)-like protein/PAS domain S-box-containing protein|uniref:PAS domain S-box/diguanylate cyclase (GGDEF) domain-containing protein n=1 Tax=Sulfuritalea hydrogenivorans sk43H TaxID=1223802 RepID=W0SCS6_9PROT|nr:EAL domain-containing protein [Sulfuritalea hydrogenivorans]BAO28565.1 PAS domain S-box/diguanylate cyclase (GGDEF) domain-containing protein [Sulfuritalea hydrogenivorans sk43H]
MAAIFSDASSLMKSVREEVVMTTYSVGMVAGTVLMLGNMSRNLDLGNSLSIPHSVLYLSFLTVYVLRKRIGAQWLAAILLMALYLGGTFGYLIYGFIGNSAPLYLTLCIIAATFYGPRGGMAAAIAAGATMTVVATLAISGNLVYSYDLKSFVGSPFSWVAALTTFAAMAAMMLTQVGQMHRRLESLLRDQQARIKEMADANLRLNAEIAARTTVEAELRRQSALLENILGNLPQGISVFDDRLKLLVWNEGMVDVLELPHEIVVRGVAFEDLIRIPAQRGDYGPGDPEEQVRQRRELALKFEPHSFERTRASGRTHLVVGKPFHLDGRIAGFITTYTDITDRKQAELEIRRSNAVLQSILDNMPGGVSVVNGDLRMIACNQLFKQLLEMPDELFVDPQPSFESFIRYNAARGEYGDKNLEQKIAETLERARHPVAHMFERERPNGSVLEIRGAPLPDGGFITIYTDVTARKQAERELLHLHERFSLALKTVGLGIFDWDAKEDKLLADARVFEIFGVSPNGRNNRFNDWTDYLHPEDREQTLARIIAMLRAKEADFKLSYRIVRPDGEIRHLEVHNHIVRDASGRTLRLIGADFDVTERKRTEERLRLTEQVFDHSPVAIVITDSENRIISVNESFVRISGYGESEVLGRDPKFLASGLHNAEFFERMWQALQEGDFWEGEVWDRRKTGEIYPKWMTINVVRDREDAGRMHYVAIFSDITERKQAEEHIHHLAHHDPLTTLPNRMALEARLEQSIAEANRNQRSVAVMFLDLDRFKTINDTLGHHVGDLLLIEVARRLRQTVRSSDTVARHGGDEFVVVLPALETPDVAATLAGNILKTLSEPYLIDGNTLHSTPSIGVSLYPQDGRDVDTVMKYADTAMYHAKDMGRNGFQFFSPEMNRAAMERLDIERQLRDALKLDQFALHYQPRLDRNGRVTGVEALIRWNRPGHGLQPPGRFIPIAEESDLIILIGEWVLATAAAQLVAWQKAGIEMPSVAINLSARQLRLAGLPGQIAAVLQDSRLPAALLEFEVTETMAMENPERASRLLGELRDMGIALAIDDFGTGYSSLAYLKRLPFDHLKIDRSFVAGIAHDQNDVAIVRGTIALAHSLGLTVVAEGVETAEQLALLKSADCDEFQGFHFSRPLPADELEVFLGKHSQTPTPP